MDSKPTFSTDKGNRILGAILLFVSVLLLFFNFIGIGGAAFVSIGLLSGVSPLMMFIGSFALMGAGGAWILLGLIYLLLFIACFVLPIVTGVMALVNKHHFSKLWACITGIVHGVFWLIVSIIIMTIPGSMAGMAGLGLSELGMLGANIGMPIPTLWLLLYLGCVIAPLFLLWREEQGSDSTTTTGGETNTHTEQIFVDPNTQTVVGNKPNKQGVNIQVHYTDDSGTHYVRRKILTSRPLTIGRSEECGLVLDDGRASSWHAKLSYDDLNGLVIEDTNSRNGIQVNGETVLRQRKITKDDTIRMGDSKLQFIVAGTLDEMEDNGRGDPPTLPSGERYHEPVRVRLSFMDDAGQHVENLLLKDSAMLGRARECEVQIESSTVSQKHARLANWGNGRIAIEDNSSSNHVKVNGAIIDRMTPVTNGDMVTLGSVVIRVTIG